MSFNICERETSYCLIRSPYRPKNFLNDDFKQKQKYRGMFETQKSKNKTSSGDIGLNIRTFASPKVGQDQVSGGVSVLCWHAFLDVSLFEKLI